MVDVVGGLLGCRGELTGLRGIGHVVEQDSAVVGHGQSSAVRAERHATRVAGVVRHSGHWGGTGRIGDVPQLDLIVDDGESVRVRGDGQEGSAVEGGQPHRMAWVGDVPQPYGYGAAAGGDQVAVTGYGDAVRAGEAERGLFPDEQLHADRQAQDRGEHREKGQAGA